MCARVLGENTSCQCYWLRCCSCSSSSACFDRGETLAQNIIFINVGDAHPPVCVTVHHETDTMLLIPSNTPSPPHPASAFRMISCCFCLVNDVLRRHILRLLRTICTIHRARSKRTQALLQLLLLLLLDINYSILSNAGNTSRCSTAKRVASMRLRYVFECVWCLEVARLSVQTASTTRTRRQRRHRVVAATRSVTQTSLHCYGRVSLCVVQ